MAASTAQLETHDGLIAELREIVGEENVLSEPDELLVYECDGLPQHKHPPRAVVIELARMRKILRVDPENRIAVVQTGLVNAHLSRAVAPYGLYYVPDPSSQPSCTIGGNIAENAGGIHCLKYGTTTDHILGARVVLADGAIVDLG